MRKEVRNILVQGVILILMFLAGLKNPLFWIVSLSAFAIIMTYLFKMKNWKQELYYAALFPVLVAEVLVLVYTYLFRTVYLQDLIFEALFVAFIVLIVMLVITYVYYYFHRKENSF
ncbi:MAG: hypothetical protein K8E24_015565 [Methanobacterium paludis]|nr:hypothetical protein [Methanobacterium paludis]